MALKINADISKLDKSVILGLPFCVFAGYITLHRLATDVPFIAYVINLPCTFTHYLELSNFQFYFMIWIVVF